MNPLFQHKNLDQMGTDRFSSDDPSKQATFGKNKAAQKNNVKNNILIPQQQIYDNKNKICQIEDKTNNKNKKKENRKLTEKYYLSREIALTVEKYGRELFSCIKDNESKFLIPMNFMERHSLSSYARERMVNWMVEVFSVYQCDQGTFELAVHIMDSYISKTKKNLQDEDIHLLGLTCIYIASKIEDIIPLRMSHIVGSLGHNTFDENTIIKKELEIVKTVDFDFFTAGTYEYLMTFFCDLKVNNAKKISEFPNGTETVEKFIKFSVFLSQLLLYSEEFVCYRQSLNALAILALALDILKTNSKNLDKNLKNFISDWVYYVMNEMKYETDVMSTVYSKIVALYEKKVIAPQQKCGKINSDDDEEEIINLCKFNQDKFI